MFLKQVYCIQMPQSPNQSQNCIAAISVWVNVCELFLTFIIMIFQVTLCCNLANFYSFLHDISEM